MKVEVGPVSHESAVAWLDYATDMLVELRSVPMAPLASPLPAHALDLFDGLLFEWQTIAAKGGRWRWVAELPAERVEFLIRALYEAGLVIERENKANRARLRPPEADEFHVVLVECVLSALEGEGPSNAQFVESLRDEWSIARRA